MAQQPGTISGTVLDSVTHKPLTLVNVALQSAAGTKLKTTVTTEKGQFALQVATQSPGSQLAVSYVGYDSKLISLPASASALGEILLAPVADQLSGVTVTARPPLVKQEIDRLTYDVQSDPQSKGQSAMDMLRRVPLLTVDGDDNIQLQGSGNYRIFINGKPSALVTNNPKDVLRSMSASIIQKIEVITTPPAKYDSEGLAGIINIITTKKTAEGYNGTVSLRQNIPFGPNININGTYKKDKFGLSMYGGTGISPITTTGQDNLRETFGASPSTLFQTGTSGRNNKFVYAGGELSYEIDSLQLLTASGNYFQGRIEQFFDRMSTNKDVSGAVLQSYRLSSEGYYRNKGIDVGLNYQLGFKHRKDQLLTTSYRYSYSLNEQAADIRITDVFKFTQPNNTQRNDANFNEHTIQVDYVHPLNKITMEAGAKAILRTMNSDATGQIYSSTANGYINDPTRANQFRYSQDVYSIYNSYQAKLTKWTFQGGVRAELTRIAADFTSTATRLNLEYTNLVPTVSVMRLLEEGRTLTFGITNRLMRPGITMLNPFVDRSNPQIISGGNPDLRPVISHLFELGYNKVYKSGSLNTKLSYMYTNNNIESVTRILADTLSQTTFDNVGQSRIARINVAGNFTINPKWSVNFNTGIFYVWVRGVYNGKFFSNHGPRTNTFANATYKPNSIWQFGASGGYNRRYVNLQGGSNDYWYTSFSATCNLKKWSFSAIANNPFMTHYSFTMFTATEDFHQSNTSHMIYRNFNLSVSYKFGGLSSGLKKNRRGINNDDAAGGN